MKKGTERLFCYLIKEYNKLIEKLEDFEDVRLYDEAKRVDDGYYISIDEAYKIIEEKLRTAK